MKNFIKRFWWVLLIILVIFLIFYSSIHRSFQPATDQTSPDRSAYNPLEKILSLGSDDRSYYVKLSFISVVPTKFKVNAYQEIQLQDSEVLSPNVSPDGSKVVIVQKSPSKTKLAIVDLDSRAITPLDLGFDNYECPSWSSGGTKLVFAGLKGQKQEIYTFDLENKKLVQVTKAFSRKPTWPRYSPYTFDGHYRIVYVSNEKGRKDIWWIRENGEDDRPLTIPPDREKEFMSSERWASVTDVGPPTKYTTIGGDYPEWSPSGDTIMYKTQSGKYTAINYSYYDWWKPSGSSFPSTKGLLAWCPNQTAFLSYDPAQYSASYIAYDGHDEKKIAVNKILTSSPAFFPDGKGVAYVFKKDGKSVLALESVDDPTGDITNLWLYTYSKPQKEKLQTNQMLFRFTGNEQIYGLYESESYDEMGSHERPYFVTSDAVLETFYAAFSALLGYVERVEFKHALEDFATKGLAEAKTKNAPPDVQKFFLTGLVLIQPNAGRNIPPDVQEEVKKIRDAQGQGTSLFGYKISYSDFLVRGKYERDKDLQSFFQALKWFQTFKFDLREASERKWVAALLDVLNTPDVSASIERINLLLKNIIGESRYYGPLTLKTISSDGQLPQLKPSLPWIETKSSFTLLPFIYTLDAHIFDELITHLDKPETVGTAANPRLLPTGMDIMAALGSGEAKKILLDELKENRYEHYVKKLDEVARRIGKFPKDTWDQNLYQAWLGLLNALISGPPSNVPDFAKTKAWQRKGLNTSLGSWVNLRFETVAYVEQVAAEAGEGGYEVLNIGYPRGYVEPNPVFFQKLDESFGSLAETFRDIIRDRELRDAVNDRIEKYRKHLKSLKTIAQKELDNLPLTDEEYAEIYFIGRTVEHFILIMNSLSPPQSGGGGLSRPDPITKIVDVQKSDISNEVLYEALGPANEIDVIVPYYGRRQIVKGPVYSYYEFRSHEVWKNDRWRDEFNQNKEGKHELPVWIKEYYE